MSSSVVSVAVAVLLLFSRRCSVQCWVIASAPLLPPYTRFLVEDGMEIAFEYDSMRTMFKAFIQHYFDFVRRQHLTNRTSYV